nr:MAG TPA: hypothetical protein [Caudoviricetes sp.]
MYTLPYRKVIHAILAQSRVPSVDVCYLTSIRNANTVPITSTTYSLHHLRPITDCRWLGSMFSLSIERTCRYAVNFVLLSPNCR